MPDCAGPVTADEHVECRNLSLATVLNELKVHDLNINPQLKYALLGVIERCLDAFAANDDDLGHTTVVEHSINIGDAAPIKEKL